MEEDISKVQKTETVVEKRVKTRLASAIKKAETKINYEAAHDPELLRALDTVKQFLKKKRRVCYGGTAMNAILPAEKHFYDPEFDVPDYDFFTPELEDDVEEIVATLKRANFKEVYEKMGIHEGTKKILVNYIPIADITHLSPTIYRVFFKRSIIREKIHYTDPEILRMMMYLELSRPKGMVDRWSKVYERLSLINQQFPPKRSLGYTRRVEKKEKAARLPLQLHDAVFSFCIEKQRSIVTGNLDAFYEKAITNTKAPMFHTETYKGIIGWLTPDLRGDAKHLQTILGGAPTCRIFLHPAKSEIVSEYVEVRYNDTPAILLVEESACHSYLSFPLNDGRSICIASLDTLITLYYSIAIFTVKARQYIPKIESQIAKFVALDEKNRVSKNPKIPAFPLICHGYQKGYSTLLREKVKRVQEEKKLLKDIE
jgi:hypothetical protein